MPTPIPPSADTTNDYWAAQPPAKMARSYSSQPSSQSTRGAVAYSGAPPGCGPMPWAMPSGLNGPVLPPSLAQMPPELAMAVLQQQQQQQPPPPMQAQQQLGAKQFAPHPAPPQQQQTHPQQQPQLPSYVQQQQMQQSPLMAAFAQQSVQPQVRSTTHGDPTHAAQPQTWPQPWSMPMLDMQALTAVMSNPSIMAQLLQNPAALANPAPGPSGPHARGAGSAPDAANAAAP